MWGNPYAVSEGKRDPEVMTEDKLEEFIRNFDYPLAGSGRVVFRCEGKGVVYKVALNAAGLQENATEVAVSESQEVPTAHAVIENVLGVDVVAMEIVEPIEDPREYFRPDQREEYDWIRSIDMWQVGLTADGRVVAYDLGRWGEKNASFQKWEND